MWKKKVSEPPVGKVLYANSDPHDKIFQIIKKEVAFQAENKGWSPDKVDSLTLTN